MSERQVSDELAIAVIDLVRECQWNNDSPWAGAPDRPPALGDTTFPGYVDGVKPAIAKVIDLLAVEVARDIAAAMEAAGKERTP